MLRISSRSLPIFLLLAAACGGRLQTLGLGSSRVATALVALGRLRKLLAGGCA